jgi:hypothetical protein
MLIFPNIFIGLHEKQKQKLSESGFPGLKDVEDKYRNIV